MYVPMHVCMYTYSSLLPINFSYTTHHFCLCLAQSEQAFDPGAYVLNTWKHLVTHLHTYTQTHTRKQILLTTFASSRLRASRPSDVTRASCAACVKSGRKKAHEDVDQKRDTKCKFMFSASCATCVYVMCKYVCDIRTCTHTWHILVCANSSCRLSRCVRVCVWVCISAHALPFARPRRAPTSVDNWANRAVDQTRPSPSAQSRASTSATPAPASPFVVLHAKSIWRIFLFADFFLTAQTAHKS